MAADLDRVPVPRRGERAERNHRSLEAEARIILEDAAARPEPTMLDYLAMPETAHIDFEPERLGIRQREIEF
ncbi:FitA-like ribbon-helix-helix domain-containing protein [Myceligenerans crystallogenes]|uniref:Antitoxin FitA-like ribbon-helix-helix domain-containing protein n=1 Tax=Myceligenerans crystallogenes TaxID=316335 RepID=A0ABN2N9X1_9MICO